MDYQNWLKEIRRDWDQKTFPGVVIEAALRNAYMEGQKDLRNQRNMDLEEFLFMGCTPQMLRAIIRHYQTTTRDIDFRSLKATLKEVQKWANE